MMVKPTEREKEIINRMYEINIKYNEIFIFQDIDTRIIDIDKVPIKYRRIAEEYNKLKEELRNY